MKAQEILTVLKLDKKEFTKGFSETQKDILKVSAAVAGFGAAALASAKLTANFQDATIKMSRSAGVSSEAFSKLKLAAELGGAGTEVLAKGLIKLGNPSETAKKQLDALGISTKDLNGNARNTEEVFKDLADKIKNLNTPAQRVSVAMGLFGEEGVKLVSVLKDGSVGLDELGRKAKAMGLVVTQEAGGAAEKFNDDLTILSKTLEGVTYQTGQAVIAFVNESGIIEAVSDAIQEAVLWYDSLDKETRMLIEGSVLAAAGIAALTVAAAGAGVAFIALLAFINPVTLAIAGIIAVVSALAYAFIKYWSQIKPAIEPVKIAFEQLKSTAMELFRIFKQAASNVGSMVKALLGIGDVTADSTDEISILGTVASVVFKVIATGALIVIKSFQILLNTTLGYIKIFKELASAVYQFFTGDFRGASSALGRAFDEGRNLVATFINDVKESGKAISNIWSGDVLVKNIKSATAKVKDELNGISDGVNPVTLKVDAEFKRFQEMAVSTIEKTAKDIGKAWSNEFSSGQKLSLGEQVTDISKGFGDITSQAMQMADSVMSAMVMQAEITVRSLKQQQEQAGFFFALYAQAMEKQMQEELDSMQRQEDEKIRILEAGKNERLLLLDEEYQEAKRLRELEFQDFLEAERLKYEANLELQQQQLTDKGLLAENEAVNREDWNAYVEVLEQNHSDNLLSLQDEFNGRKKQTETEGNLAIEAARDAAEKRREAKEAENDKKKKDASKAAALTKWTYEVAIAKSTQAIQAQQTMLSAVGNAAQVFGMMTATLGPIGAVIGAALGAKIIALGSQAASQIASAPPPNPPVELFAAQGGVFMGPSHAQGGITNVTMEGGEGVLSRERTSRLMQVADSVIAMGNGGGENITINVYANPGMNEQDLADKIGRVMADRTRANMSRSY
jgi:hypothetical protein